MLKDATPDTGCGLKLFRLAAFLELPQFDHMHRFLPALFIRAATEGRRDHVYQAAMFDPLTAATLSLDKIVELCDELIAAHGELLPKLDAKKTLVTTSGKSFGKVDPKTLRKSWDDAHAASKAARAGQKLA